MSVQIHQPGIDLFDHVVTDLPLLLERLLAAPAAPVAAHSAIPNAPAIYLFSELDHAIYVGQTRVLRERLDNHTNPLGKNNKASFAFNVAKEEAARAGVDTARFRAQLEADQEFASHFQTAKLRVSEMDVRYIELADPIERSVFEIYAALALDTLVFNSFETH
ncbi:MAG TPA: GIY-YIG nuclease family protein [Solirubrobacterales bacterium]